MRFEQITIVGVGLIGGSVGLAAKAKGVAARVVGVGRDRAKLDAAVTLGAIDAGTTSLAEGVAGASLVVVCTPVDRISSTIVDAAPFAPPDALFTDAGSTKRNLHAAARAALKPGQAFVPAHPLAGSEKAGCEHGRADLFESRVNILTPEPGDEAAAERVATFWRALGSRVVRMTADDHDTALATTSHLPHVVAATTAGVTPPEWLQLTAGGWRDTTRIAGGDPGMWVPIFLANRDAVLAATQQFTTRLAEFRLLLEAGDGAGLGRWLAEAKQVRDALGSGNPAARA
ncbi:prephenate dehydrogenase [Urbifossiella limnaea]|uniref:Cyclohexadienyl dehydrogenase n=1 Tax=Urbifossiella limnaea TaxID=2528023 RepID=A0A517XRE1_9BACT|nr:prephenate dehydrogenase/arogenate dehydrogenase family protein [Urbifossiella limnaea]QDU20074.1 cyclohexadienyl dehydrogenase [Urbifossiella limnaea]